MTVNTEKQVGWMLNDHSARAEGVQLITDLIFGATVSTLWEREGVTVSRQSGSHLEGVIKPPERRRCHWNLLLANRVPNSGMPRLRADFAKVHADLFKWQFDTLNLPLDLIQERQDNGLFVVPGSLELDPGELWVPLQYSLNGLERATLAPSVR